MLHACAYTPILFDCRFETFTLLSYRSHSPHSPRSKSMKPPTTAEELASSESPLQTHVKDISNALKHFRDVIFRSKLEVLPGNATVILETIASMYTVIQSYALDKHSNVLLPATQQVYQSLGKLVKLCDEVMLIYAARRIDDEGVEDNPQDEHQQLKALLSEDNVKEIVDLLAEAVRVSVLKEPAVYLHICTYVHLSVYLSVSVCACTKA